jgi:hypothetical protein
MGHAFMEHEGWDRVRRRGITVHCRWEGYQWIDLNE